MQQLHETTLMNSPGIATFEKFAFPLVRAIFPNLVATDLVSVQPMTGPASLIFYLQFVYGSDKGGTTAGTTMFDNPDKNRAVIPRLPTAPRFPPESAAPALLQ